MLFVKLLSSSCMTFVQSISNNASWILVGSMDDISEQCSQKDVGLDIVWTPLLKSPTIWFNGWSIAIVIGRITWPFELGWLRYCDCYLSWTRQILILHLMALTLITRINGVHIWWRDHLTFLFNHFPCYVVLFSHLRSHYLGFKLS